MTTTTSQFPVNLAPDGLTAIVDLVNAPNSPSEVMIQNLNGNNITVYLGNSLMWDQETFGLKLIDGATLSIALGAYDELYAFADDYVTINVLRTAGNRR